MKAKIVIIVTTILLLNSSFLINNSSAQTGWTTVTDSIPELVIMAMQFTSPNTGYAVGSYGEIFPGGFLRTTNAGMNWQFQNFPYYSADDVCFLNDNTGYISAWLGSSLGSFVLKTTNSGINWICIDTIPTSFFRMKFYNLNTGIVVSKYSVVHKTTDGGENWFTQSGAIWAEPSCIWCFDANNWLVSSSSIRLNKTTNGGINWQVLDFTNIGFDSRSLFFINNTTGFSSTYYGKIFKTTNQGYNWIQISTINNFHAYGDLYFVSDQTGYVCGSGSNHNVYKTTNGGYDWFPRSIKSPSYLIKSLYFINPDTGYAGGDFGFIYKTTTGGNVNINNISTEIPSSFSLSQNYPNPFNSMTKVKFQIANSGKVKITVFDILGKEVATLVNEPLHPGTYETTFDAGNLSSGIYFYKLQTNNFSETKKMTLIK